ncbi:MAG: UDP-3-O-(3-hydroxymyristoyl)glucosamine N-acyltransferase [Alphaproteobacteria bacterium]|nr:UDP-3-O-(3-hydroxymyristoyl)glucosamine N-acyltransferase [Alphaproteobacteria bacterium]
MADQRFYTKTEPKNLEELASIAGADLHGKPDFEVEDVASLDLATGKDISFLDNAKYKDAFKTTKAGACIISYSMAEFAPQGCQLLISKTPYKAYALIAQAFYPANFPPAKISEAAHIDKSAVIAKGCIIEAGAVIGEGVKLGEGCWIEPNAVIGKNVEIGKNSRIGANASISHTIIGEGTRLYPGVRIGQDGFGFAIDLAGHVKVPQLGRVIIGDHVEIGANSCIDRGAGPDTLIGDGTWIDNCVQIGHNVNIGRGCVIVAQAGIAGSTTLKDYVVIAAQGGVAGHLTIGQGTQIAAQSGIMQDLPAGSKVMGSPAMPIKQHLRQVAYLKKLISRN